MKSILQKIAYFLGSAAYFGGYWLSKSIRTCKPLFLTGYYRPRFRKFGKKSRISDSFDRLLGAEFISVGDNVHIVGHCNLTAIALFHTERNGATIPVAFSPSIEIRNGVQIGEYNHITAIGRIEIGENVLTGPHVLITDNSHGGFDADEMAVAPFRRPLRSKGPVIIEKNVWIGEGAQILPGVTIGEGSIIASNSVVTRNIPPYCLAAGSPAKVVKRMLPPDPHEPCES